MALHTVRPGQHDCEKPELAACPADMDYYETDWICDTCRAVHHARVHKVSLSLDHEGRTTWTRIKPSDGAWRAEQTERLYLDIVEQEKKAILQTRPAPTLPPTPITTPARVKRERYEKPSAWSRFWKAFS